MRRRGLSLSRFQRGLFYAASAVLLASGIAWAWMHSLDLSGEGGEGVRRWKPGLILAHGWAAVGFVFVLGTLVPTHMMRSWRARKNRANGVCFLAAIGLLTASGYALYYVGDEGWRAALGRFHLWGGVAAPVLLLWHVRSGWKATGSKLEAAP